MVNVQISLGGGRAELTADQEKQSIDLVNSALRKGSTPNVFGRDPLVKSRIGFLFSKRQRGQFFSRRDQLLRDVQRSRIREAESRAKQSLPGLRRQSVAGRGDIVKIKAKDLGPVKLKGNGRKDRVISKRLGIRLGPQRITKEKIRKFIGIGFKKFTNEAKKEETKIQADMDQFSQSRLNFYQGQLNRGNISEAEANKRLNEDVNKEFQKKISGSEFFRKKDKRRSTTNALAFEYETQRLQALKDGNQKKADTLLFLETVADSPSALFKLGFDTVKGINKLFKDPEARETSKENIKEIFKKDNLKTLPSKFEVKADELKNFIQTSPGTALAIVGGSLIGFSIIAKVGKPILKITGIASKKTSKEVIKKLKFKPLTKKGLEGIGKISIEVSPKVFKKTFGAQVGRDFTRIRKAPKKIMRAFNESIKKSQVGRDIKKVKKKLSRQQLRIKRRKIISKLKKEKVVRDVETAVRRARELKKKIKERKNILIQRLKKKKRRKILELKEKKKRILSKLKKEKIVRDIKKLAKIPKKIKKEVSKSKIGIRARKLEKSDKRVLAKRERARVLKLTRERRIEKEKRRSKLLRQERFKKTGLGKLKIKVSKNIKELDKIIKRFEDPKASLVFKKSKTKTPLSKTFPREVKLGINDKAVERFVKLQVKKRGFDYDKLTGIEKNFLIGQVKARIRNNPEKFISKTQKRALKRFEEKQLRKLREIAEEKLKKEFGITVKEINQVRGLDLTIPKIRKEALEKFRRKELKKIKKKIESGEIISMKDLTKTEKKRLSFEAEKQLSERLHKKSKPVISPREKLISRQRLIQLQTLKIKPVKQIITELQIAPTELTKTQQLALKNLRKVQSQRLQLQQQVKGLKQKVKLKQKPVLRSRQQRALKSKSKQLNKLALMSAVLLKQIPSSKVAQKTGLKVTPRSVQKITPKITPRVTQKIGTKPKIVPVIKPLVKPIRVPLIVVVIVIFDFELSLNSLKLIVGFLLIPSGLFVTLL